MSTGFLRKGRKKYVALAAIIVLVAGIIGLNIYRSQSASIKTVNTVSVEKRLMGEIVYASGHVQLKDKQDIYANSVKELIELKCKEGDKVKQGQVLIVLDSKNEEMNLIEARANLAREQANLQKAINPSSIDVEIAQANLSQVEITYQLEQNKFARTQALFDEGVLSQQEHETAKKDLGSVELAYLKARKELERLEKGPIAAERKALEASLQRAEHSIKIAEQKLAECQIKAGIDGVITELKVSQGDILSIGQKVLSISDLEQLEIKVGINEADAGRVKLGQDVIIESSTFPGREIKGKVEKIGLIAEVNQRDNFRQIEVPVVILIESGGEGLMAGFTVDLRIITIAEKERLSIPYEAIIEENGDKYVFIVQEEIAEKRIIEIGLQGDLYQEVIKGINENDKIINTPPEDLEDGQEVKELNSN